MARKPIKRDDDITSRVDEDDLLKLYEDVEKGFANQRDRADEILDNWDLYNCRLGEKQFYNGTSEMAMPFVHDAVEARVTRFTNQVFPQSQRCIEVTTGEDDQPQATQALLEHYVRKTKLRTRVVPALFRNGDIEGSYNVLVGWKERTRHAQFKVKKQPTTDGKPNAAAEEVEDIEEEEITDGYPDVEVLSDADVLVMPPTAESVDDALDDGGSVTVIRRWTKGKIRRLIDEGEIEKDKGEDLIDTMNNAQKQTKDPDTAKDQLDSAGIKERGKVVVVYMTWHRLKVQGERRLCRIYFAGQETVVGVKLNPYWNDRCPILSSAVDKMAGTFKSRAPVCAVADLQILANDTINEGADTSHMSAAFIVMTDPLKNPRLETLTLAPAAVWELDPNTTEIVTIPELWKTALERATAIRDQIFQTLSVSPAMIPQQTGKQQKRNQAEMAIEQQVDLLTTADAVTGIEESILTPLVQWFAELDHQFRDEETTVRTYGPLGEDINMEQVEPIQLNKRFEFRWFGVESARSGQLLQQQIAWVNVMRGIPANLYPDYDLNVAPMLVLGTENVFGPRDAHKIFRKKQLISVDPLVENIMLENKFVVPVHEGDDDVLHMAAHSVLTEGDIEPAIQQAARQHMAKHQMQLLAKQQGQPNQAGGGSPGDDGQGGGDGGGGPRSGGQATGPNSGKTQPAGSIHPDNVGRAGVVTMPRRTG